MKRISHLLLVCGFVVVTSNLTACNKIDDVDIYENNTSDIKWNDVADSTTNALIEHFWHKDKHYFVYNSDAFHDRKHPGYWPQAHAMDVVIDAYLRTHDQKYAKLFPLWFEGIKKGK
jgi:glycosyl hydrolase family 76